MEICFSPSFEQVMGKALEVYEEIKFGENQYPANWIKEEFERDKETKQKGVKDEVE